MTKNILMYTPEKEHIVRKKWLISFYIYAFWTFFYYGFLAALGCNVYKMNNKDFVLMLFVFTLVIGLLLAHYYFGYKKGGTRLLVWITILGGLKFISKIPETTSEIKQLIIKFGLTNSIINCYYILEIGAICVCTYYLISCWKLYLLNVAIKDDNRKNEKDFVLTENGESYADIEKN